MSAKGPDLASAPTVLLPVRLRPGAVFADRYEVLGTLGEGGMGTVFRVLDRELREEIALKVLHAELEGTPGALERFRREVKLARRVTHPNVARTFDLGSHDGVRYLTMELVAGEPLSRHARRWGPSRRAPMPEALRIGAEIARGLAAAHAVGVVHRDLKPDNVLLARATPSDPLERVVLTDFGIARAAHDAGFVDTATRTAALVGTPAYMAPEQLEGREVDGRTDVYALGLVLFELLTGAPAFQGDSVYALAAARMSGPIPDPRARDATIPEPVARVVVDALARDRDERPDAQAIVERLDALRGGAAHVPARAPRPPSSGAALHDVRALAVVPLRPFDGAAAEIAAELDEALGDAIASIRGLRTIAPAKVRSALAGRDPADSVALARAIDAGVVLEGSVRVAGPHVRARLRLVDVERQVTTWAERFEGEADDPFALEDDVVRAASESLRAREGEGKTRGGPLDPRVREVWERARTEYRRYVLPHVHEAIRILEEGLERHAGDAWLLSLLGTALTRAWLQTGASDRDLVARAEEQCLRALAIDPTIGDTFHTISVLRSFEGEGRASIRALDEALARAPLHAEAHQDLGRLLVETGHVDEGLERLHLALRLEPNLLLAWFEIARAHALRGDRPASEAALARAVAQSSEASVVLPRLRLATWWRDEALADQLADRLEGERSGAIWEHAAPMLRAFARGERWDAAADLFERLATDARSAPRHRAFMYELAAEYFGLFAAGDEDARARTLDAVERAAELPLLDVFWMDRCPTLDAVRGDPRFLRARATVAARAAELWA